MCARVAVLARGGATEFAGRASIARLRSRADHSGEPTACAGDVKAMLTYR